MSRLRRVRGRELIRAPERAGVRVVRVRGSHHFLRHADGRATVVSLHAGEEIGPGLLNAILADCDLRREQLRALL